MLDHRFLEIAYLSELWAAKDLQNKSGRYGSSRLTNQIEDEYRHAEMLRRVMRQEGYTPCDDVSYAMQNVLFHDVGMVDLAETMKNQAVFEGVHEIMERRAIWCYRTYLAGGSVQRYKNVLRIIIQDERGHIFGVSMANPLLTAIKKLDSYLFRVHLPRHYNQMNLLKCDKFWHDYFDATIVPIGN